MISVATEPEGTEEVETPLVKYLVLTPKTVDEFDTLMAALGDYHREIEALMIERDQKVAEIDKPYNNKRKVLVEIYNATLAACTEFASNPANKARMTKKEAPQTADLTHSKVKWTDDHTGQIELAEGVTEEQAIRAFQHRRGGGIFIKVERKLVWPVIRSKAQQATIEGMKKYFRRTYKPTDVKLYIKPASTPKPDGKAAETQVKPLS